MSCSFWRSFLKVERAQVPRPARAPNTSQQVFGIGGYAEGILQRLQGERTLSPSPGNSLFATAPHRLRLAFATLNTRMISRDRRAVARERHGLFRCGAFSAARTRRPSIQLLGSGIAPRPEYLDA